MHISLNLKIYIFLKINLSNNFTINLSIYLSISCVCLIVLLIKRSKFSFITINLKTRLFLFLKKLLHLNLCQGIQNYSVFTKRTKKIFQFLMYLLFFSRKQTVLKMHLLSSFSSFEEKNSV